MFIIFSLLALTGLALGSSLTPRVPGPEIAKIQARYRSTDCLSVTYNETHGFGDRLGMGSCEYSPMWSLEPQVDWIIRLHGAEDMVLDGMDKNATSVEVKLQSFNETSRSQRWYYRNDNRIVLIYEPEPVKKCLTLVTEPNPEYKPELGGHDNGNPDNVRFLSETIDKLKLEVCAGKEDENSEFKQIWERY